MADRLVFVVVLLSAAFVAGMELGEQKSAVELKPCPQYPMEKLAYSVHGVDGETLTCAYLKTYGRAVKIRKG
jgi:hypothetical protein